MLRKCQRHWEEQEEQRRDGQGAGHLPDGAARLQQRLLVFGRKETSATWALLGQRSGQRRQLHL